MRRFPYSSLTILLLCTFVLLSIKTEAKGPKGKEKTVADNTFGEGGTKTTFYIRNIQLTLFQDANNNRRLLENNFAYSGTAGYSTYGKTYYNNLGIRDFTKIEAYDANKTVVQQIISDYTAAGELSAVSTWLLQNGIRKEYDFSVADRRYVTGGIRLNDDYRIVNSAFPRIDLSGLTKPVFPYTILGSQPYRSTVVSNIYTGGKDVTEAYMDYDDEEGEYKVVEKKAYDKNGVLRHEIYREYYYDGCMYEEEYYYNCYGNLEYRSYTFYDEDGYDYEFCEEEYKDDELASGYYYYDGYNYGEEYYYGDPLVSVKKRIKDLFTVKDWQPTLKTTEDYTTNFEDCPDAEVFWDHEFYIAPMLLKEDGETNFYGLELSYTRHPCDRGGYIGDIRANFGSNFDYKFTRITALLGGVYYPIKTASLKNDFQFMVRGMVGATYLSTRYDNGSFSNSNSDINFTADAGIGFNYKINKKWGIGVRAGYAPVFAKGFTANNWGVSAGVIFR